jgi:hypothetical protein
MANVASMRIKAKLKNPARLAEVRNWALMFCMENPSQIDGYGLRFGCIAKGAFDMNIPLARRQMPP